MACRSKSKICPECKVRKDLATSYHRNRTQTDGHAWTCKDCVRKYMKGRQERTRCLHYRRKFGITLERFRELKESQGGRCAICRADEPGGHGTFHVDHCHETGVVRGLLCYRCNVGLGYFKDDPETVARAFTYLGGDED